MGRLEVEMRSRIRTTNHDMGIAGDRGAAFPHLRWLRRLVIGESSPQPVGYDDVEQGVEGFLSLFGRNVTNQPALVWPGRRREGPGDALIRPARKLAQPGVGSRRVG